MAIETSIVKAGQYDPYNSLFYAEALDGSLQVAHSDKTFFGSTGLQTPDAQAALNDLVAKLQALGWQQVTVGIPSPWNSLEFKRVVKLASRRYLRYLVVRRHLVPDRGKHHTGRRS
jgi:hypothetical protein